jgi:hypothetical protein
MLFHLAVAGPNDEGAFKGDGFRFSVGARERGSGFPQGEAYPSGVAAASSTETRWWFG